MAIFVTGGTGLIGSTVFLGWLAQNGGSVDQQACYRTNHLYVQATKATKVKHIRYKRSWSQSPPPDGCAHTNVELEASQNIRNKFPQNNAVMPR